MAPFVWLKPKGDGSANCHCPTSAGNSRVFEAGTTANVLSPCVVTLQDAGPLSSDGVSSLTTKAMKQAGLVGSRLGPHLLRHTVASHLVQRGTSLKAVADLLGHVSLNTTQVYAKVNLPLLKQVAAPWPKEVRS